MPSRPDPLKIVFFSMDGIGHLNACIGMAQSLAARGHQIYFLLNDTYAGQLKRFGFEEFLLKKSSNKQATDMMLEEEEEEEDDDVEQIESNPMRALAAQKKATGLFSSKTPLEKLRCQNSASTLLKQMYDSLVDYHPQMGFAIARINPDLIILDHFLVPPALPISGVPWMYLFSGSPLCLHNSDKLPPFGSGYSSLSSTSTWREYKALFAQKYTKVLAQFQKKLYDRFYYKPMPEERVQQGLFFQSPYLNIYGYPAELDYSPEHSLPPNYVRVDGFCHQTPSSASIKLPEEFVHRPAGQALIYVSMGTMGSLDVELMKRVVSVLGKTKHKYIVSKGPRAAEYTLPPNCWGQAFLPQTGILPLVSLVITHGGNNTTTEAFAQGLPMVVLPLFGDQYDNAQRIAELGYGIRLETYSFSDDQLISAIDQLLRDEELRQRLDAAVERIEAAKSKQGVCEQIEQTVQRLKYGY